jgi:site-specific DNA-methyltransferase (adenine-specific)
MMEPTVHTDKYDLYLADCLDVMQDMEAGSMDAILTDIPYGTTACAWDIIIPFDKMWEGVKRVLKPRGVFVTTASQPFTSKLVMSNLEWFKYEWIWNKKRGSGSILAKVMPIKFHENIIVFSAGGHDYYPQMRTGVSQSKASGGKSSVYREKIPVVRVTNNLYYPRSILDFTGCHNMTGKVHPTQKPESLYAYLTKTYTNPGDTILDICAGSGTTGVACMQLGRRFIGVEIDPGYFEIARKRIEQAAKQMILPI